MVIKLISEGKANLDGCQGPFTIGDDLSAIADIKKNPGGVVAMPKSHFARLDQKRRAIAKAQRLQRRQRRQAVCAHRLKRRASAEAQVLQSGAPAECVRHARPPIFAAVGPDLHMPPFGDRCH